MTLIHNDKQLYRLTAEKGITERIGELFSKQLADDLIKVETEEKGLHLLGFLGHPQQGRANNKFQYVFLNGRFIRDKFISHAMKEAYRGLIEPNRYPVAFLFVGISPQAYDVNVHPTKIEVRFDNSNLIYSQILAILRQTLLGTNLDVMAKLNVSEKPVRMTTAEPIAEGMEPRRQKISEAMSEFFKRNKPISTSQQQFSFPSPTATQRKSGGIDRDSFYAPAVKVDSDEQYDSAARFIQLHDSYIVAQTADGFIIVDQHALHERIIYEDLCRRIADTTESKLEAQRLLIPESFEADDSQIELLQQNRHLIEKLGIELVEFGPKTMAIQAFPTLLSKVKPLEFMSDFLDMLVDKAGALDAERLLHEVLDMAACKAAVKAGRKLSDSEVEQLLTDKEVLARASRCPHGRPTTITFTLEDLHKQFGRT